MKRYKKKNKYTWGTFTYLNSKYVKKLSRSIASSWKLLFICSYKLYYITNNRKKLDLVEIISKHLWSLKTKQNIPVRPYLFDGKLIKLIIHHMPINPFDTLRVDTERRIFLRTEVQILAPPNVSISPFGPAK